LARAAIAAGLALDESAAVQDVNYEQLRRRLSDNQQRF
jgi:hypothetical protein